MPMGVALQPAAVSKPQLGPWEEYFQLQSIPAGYLLVPTQAAHRLGLSRTSTEVALRRDQLTYLAFCVRPSFRGQGVGERFVRVLEDIARQNEVPRAAGLSLTQAQGFWERMGYRLHHPLSAGGCIFSKDLC